MKKKTKNYLLGLFVGVILGSSIVGCFLVKAQKDLKNLLRAYDRLIAYHNSENTYRIPRRHGRIGY